MPKYNVTYYYHSAVEVEIDAEDKDTAINDARRLVTTVAMLKNIQEVDNGAELLDNVKGKNKRHRKNDTEGIYSRCKGSCKPSP